jgi:uncharacterized membrane protein YqiK
MRQKDPNFDQEMAYLEAKIHHLQTNTKAESAKVSSIKQSKDQLVVQHTEAVFKATVASQQHAEYERLANEAKANNLVHLEHAKTLEGQIEAESQREDAAKAAYEDNLKGVRNLVFLVSPPLASWLACTQFIPLILCNSAICSIASTTREKMRL